MLLLPMSLLGDDPPSKELVSLQTRLVNLVETAKTRQGRVVREDQMELSHLLMLRRNELSDFDITVIVECSKSPYLTNAYLELFLLRKKWAPGRHVPTKDETLRNRLKKMRQLNFGFAPTVIEKIIVNFSSSNQIYFLDRIHSEGYVSKEFNSFTHAIVNSLESAPDKTIIVLEYLMKRRPAWFDPDAITHEILLGNNPKRYEVSAALRALELLGGVCSGLGHGARKSQ